MSQPTIEERIARLENAVATMTLWLAQTPGVWGQRDYDGIMKILHGETEASEGDSV